jgi:NodT family efflux transporter outer membrane factor (OMF) lipoprotein
MFNARNILGRAMPWAASALLAGCVPSLVNNPPRDANKAVPNQFGEAAETTGEAPKAAENVGGRNWKDFFSSPDVQKLIEEALKNNQELNIRLQEIVIAQNEVAARRGEYLPRLNARVGAGVEKAGEFTRQGRNDEASGLGSTLGDFGFGVVASWEVDIWGKLRNAAKAADLRYLASVESKNFMVTQLIAEIARSYYDLIALDNQIEVLKRNIQIQADALEVVKIEKTAARVTELAVQRFEAEVLKNKSRLYDLEQERVQTENRLNFLVGRYPQPVARNAQELQAPLPGVLQAGLPSQLLENRPDVRQAEMELEAAKLDVSAARKNFYPSLSIDAELGYRSFNLSHLVSTPASIVFGLAGGLTAPLLNRTGIEATYRSANARQLQAVYNYERTLLQAFTDVASQLVKYEKLQKGYDLQSQQVKKLESSINVSTVLFKSARADYMEVLMTRRDALDAELELIETKKRVLQSTVGIYQALGGGWQSKS